ncbi:hypothetical protein SSX86_008766 [Deinandra increscens subsp. villosa]|uniref:Ubiquitin-like protease family profile domain-containing protein n=1 Tax=Deinandra increscens subsp. villosa TaxID=3103831 RepID=A0AAP0DGP2_9ASTR
MDHQYSSQPNRNSDLIRPLWRFSKKNLSSSSGCSERNEDIEEVEPRVYAQEKLIAKPPTEPLAKRRRWAIPDDECDNWSKDVLEFYNNGDQPYCYSALFFQEIKLDKSFWGPLLGYGPLSTTADVRIRFNLGIINEIRDKLNEDQFVIWDSTCFHKWLSAGCVSAGTKICHALFHHEVLVDDGVNGLIYEFGGKPYIFGPLQFCLMTGFSFWKKKAARAEHEKARKGKAHVGNKEVPVFQYSAAGFLYPLKMWIIETFPELLRRRERDYVPKIPRCLGPRTCPIITWADAVEMMTRADNGLKMQSVDGASATTPSTSKKNVVEERTGSSNGWNIQEDPLLLEAGTKWRTPGDLGKAPERPVTDGVTDVYHTPTGAVNTVAHDYGDLVQCLDFTLIDEDEVYVPVNMCAHWYLVAFDLLHWTYTVYDSLETPIASTYVTNYTKELVYRFSHWLWFFDFYTARGKKTEFVEFTRLYEDVPQQVGTSDCGVWLCMFLDRLTSYESVKQKNKDQMDDPLQYRRKMAKVFYEHRLAE